MSCCDNQKSAPPLPSPPPVVVAPCPTCLIVRITDIAGLYQPGVDDRPLPAQVPDTTRGSGYIRGYTSSDGKGRILINSVPGTPPLLDNSTWTKNKQFIEITVVVDPPSVTIPPGSKITWSFDDPDDPTNEGPDVHVDAGKLLDPNDYTGAPPTKSAAVAGDNDPNGKKQESPGFEQVEAKYALSGNDTLIDISTRTSKVRFNVSDIAGDNWKVKADIHPIAPITVVTPATTGIMTAWNRIQVEYVRMSSAAELPVDQIALHYDKACVQVDVSLKRVITGAHDMPFMGADDDAARRAVDNYVTRARGEFSKEGEKGWFFIAAANRLLPATSATILYEGNAQAFGNRIRLPAGTRLSAAPAIVRVFNSAVIAGLSPPKPNDRAIHTKFAVLTPRGNDLPIVPHDFHAVDDPNHAFLLADLSNYGFAAGATIPIQVLSDGDNALVTGGISPGGKDVKDPRTGKNHHFFGGRLVVFTQSLAPADVLPTLCHELCHAFDNAHMCGNWDWKDQARRTSCCMCYWFYFVLDDANPRVPIRWTQDRCSSELCGPHLRHIRDYHLEDNPGLGWGTP